MGTEQREQMEQRALGAMLREAFFTWPSAVTIAFTLIMFGLQVSLGSILPFWQNWMWLAFGVVAEGAYLWATVTDPAAAAAAVSRMLQERFDPRDIRNQHAREQMRKALEYKSRIDEFVLKQSGAMKESLSQTSQEINDWIEQIYQLAKSIDLFEANDIIERDRRTVPTDLANLKRRLGMESDPTIKRELEDAIETREKLAASLKTIENNAKRTEIKIDNTVAQLSTVFAQMQLLNSRELDSGKAQRLREEIRDEIASLGDIVDAMGDVYDYGRGEPAYSAAVRELTSSDSASDDAAADSDERQQRRTSAGGRG
ncbi:MAG: hypothetical protein KF726_21330 [Anaerolineae bacterium]|nr:hypothetical protein [Anaerolineae bacterium]